MNNDYYCRVQKRSMSAVANEEDKKSPSTRPQKSFKPRAASDTLLIDYEVVENVEEMEEKTPATNLATPKRLQLQLPQAEGQSKLVLNLSAQKIALKSPTTSTISRKPILKNQSHLPEAELTWFSLRNANLKTIKQQQRQQAVPAVSPKREPHVPRQFAIAPPFNDKAKQQQEHSILTFKAASVECHQRGIKRQSVTVSGIQRRASIATTTTTATTSLPQKLIAVKTPTIPALKANDIETASSDPSSIQPDSSTSPESVLDQILSAASSLSLRSSSLSSGATEMTQFGSQLYAIKQNGKQNNQTQNNVAFLGHATSKCVAGQSDKQQHVVAETSAISVTPANRMLTSKAATTAVTATTTMATTELRLPLPPPPLLQITSPTLSMVSNATATPQRFSSQLSALDLCELNSRTTTRSRSPSPTTTNIAIRITPDISNYPEELKCKICMDIFRDPRTLNCLHTFCYQCLVDVNFKNDRSIPFWAQPNDKAGEEPLGNEDKNKSNYSLRSELSITSEIDYNGSVAAPSTNASMLQRGSSFSLIRNKSMDKTTTKPKANAKSSRSSSASRLTAANGTEEKTYSINCSVCNYATELPIGGLRQLPQNFLVTRKIEAIKIKTGDEIISRIWCSLCNEETGAAYHCTQCTLNLCTLCKEAHERQRNTASHVIRSIVELRKARRQKQNMLDDNTRFTLKCGMHPGFEMKAFCTQCLQVACSDCLVLLHKGHKHEPITKAINYYLKILHDAVEHSRPLCNYAEHSIERMNEIAKNINRRCDEIQDEVEKYMNQYFEAVEVHRKTLIQQINRARESKIEMVLEQQLDLEKHTCEALEAVRFSQELCEHASQVEILSFLNILLKRFDYCQEFKAPPDPKISDSLHFLPKIRAPSTKSQYEIPLYGIITMQTVEPSLCTLQWEGFSQLRLHKRVELTMLSRDADGVPLCHGGLTITALIKYKEFNSKYLPVEVSDNRDGTYIIAFTPDAQGNVMLTVTINEKAIKGSPFTFLARTVRPHTGIYHCCAFCSSKGNKMAKCSCEGRMPGYNGCGHGHAGHPGRRHWSCCGNILENSECNVANKLMNA